MNTPGLSRRSFIKASVLATALGGHAREGAKGAEGAPAKPDGKAGPIAIGSRLELFVDDFLIERLSGRADLRLHHPQPREIVLEHDEVWEGGGSGYHTVFQDGGLYRMYYKGWQLDGTNPKVDPRESEKSRACYAESDDGIHWRKPNLGLFEFRGSKANNIVIPSGHWGGFNLNAGEVSFFRDENPAATADARYKAFVNATKPWGLLAFKSADGIHWVPMSEKPIITNGSFDSQNLAFWDGVRGHYRAYWRYFTKGMTDATHWNAEGLRAIRTGISRDFLNWEQHEDLRYVDSPDEQLYTNVVKPYPRAPHILIGFPTRYTDRGWSESMKHLPEFDHRKIRSRLNPRYGTAVTEALMMASRDGVTFKRWNEAFLRDGPERNGTWCYGNQYLAWHLVETKSALGGGAPDELSLYAVENTWSPRGSSLRRHTLRRDGFVSVNAPMKGGELLTKAFTFTGARLVLNFASSAAGGIQVEVQDGSGRALPGFALDDCPPIFGDALERGVVWKGGGDLSGLQGKPVRLRFALQDADLFSLRFS